MREVIRTRILRVGDVVTVHRCAGAYTELPEGLPEGTRVRVLKVGCGNADVENGDGRRFNVYFPQIDMPRSVLWQGRWIDRLTHPQGEMAYQIALRR